MKIGCLNKNTNKTEYIYIYHRFKTLPAPYGKEPYVQYEILEEVDKYIWDEQSQSVVIDQNWVAPQPNNLKRGYDAVVNAIKFGEAMKIKFAAENVSMGITQAGKTKVVADYLENVMKYMQSGSLYEVVNEIDALIAAGVPADLDPYVTQTRLNEFKQEILDYLT